MARTSRTRHVAVVAYPGVHTLDVVGPLEVFAAATRLLTERGAASPAYRIEILAARPGPVRTQSGLGLVAARAWRGVREPIDTLLVAGGMGTEDAMADAALLAWLRRQAPRVRRLGSVCSGAFILAEAGLLDGRRATTHWAWCDALAARHPRVRVERDPIFVRDGDVWTSAGVTAGMDLALALVEDDVGRDVALTVARQMVLFLQRPGGQSQFSAALAAQAAERPSLRDLQAWITDHPDETLSVASLARRAAMSPRNFARAFRREVGMTPGRFVEAVRVEAARRRLEETADGVEEIAGACGFGTAESMRRAFVRTVHVAPSQYRSRFRLRPTG